MCSDLPYPFLLNHGNQPLDVAYVNELELQEQKYLKEYQWLDRSESAYCFEYGKA